MKIYLMVMFALLSHSVLAGKVLIIESYHAGYAWDESYLGGIEQVLDADHQIVTFEMNTKRLPREDYPLMAEKAYRRYLLEKPDIVILGDDNALNYMLPKLYQENIPIVFLGINSNPRRLLAKYRGKAQVTGVLELPLLAKTMGEIGAMLPDEKKKIRVLFDSGVTSMIAQTYMRQQYKMLKEHMGIEAEILTVSTLSEWQSLVLDAGDQGVGAIVVGLYHTLVDEFGNNVEADTVLSWTNKISTVPLFGFWDFSVGVGKAAGGVVLFGENQGITAGEIAEKILQGKVLAKDVPIRIGRQGRAIYVKEEMARWGLTPPKRWQVFEE